MATRTGKSSNPPSNGKKLKVQISVCKRMRKEVEAYEKEVVTNEARVQRMRDEDRDIYDIRKQEEVLQESYMMIPDSKRRYEAAIDELREVKDACVEDGEEGVNELLAEAAEIISAFDETK